MENGAIEYDLVVVGAGLNGLVAAQTYKRTHQTASVLICESNSTLGGVWAEDRLYPHLQTNNLYGTYEFPDFPSSALRLDGVQEGRHMRGHVVHQYLHSYATAFDLHRLIAYGSRVRSATCLYEDGWMLDIGSVDGTYRQVMARRLVMATGLSSEPRILQLPGQETFKVQIYYGKDLARINLSGLDDVVVLGGTKMGWDAVYHFAVAGVKVNWIIRKSGHGPAWMGVPHVTPLKLYAEDLAMTRAVSWLSPSVFATRDGLDGIMRWLLNSTWLGGNIVKAFFDFMGHDLVDASGLNKSDERRKLIPWCSPLWVGANRGIISSYDTPILDFVDSGMIRVHIDEITQLSDDRVFLRNGDTLQADALIACTGWEHKPTIEFLPEGIDASLGIPTTTSNKTKPNTAALDAQIFRNFPLLADQPPVPAPTSPSPSTGQYALHRAIVPPPPFTHYRTLAFAGYVQSIITPVLATVQALWITAYFANELPHVYPGNDAHIAYETALHARFARWRYPWGFGGQFPNFLFDGIPYLDMLLGDLGLETRRLKRKLSGLEWMLDLITLGLWGWVVDGLVNAFCPYRGIAYAGLMGEWEAVRSRKKMESRISGHGKS